MGKRIFCAFVCILAVGCASLNKSTMTRFEPFTEGGKSKFRFSSERNDSVYPDDSEGESVRIGWLNEYIFDNNLCGNGYVIDSRVVVKGGDLYGLRKSYYYVGSCKP